MPVFFVSPAEGGKVNVKAKEKWNYHAPVEMQSFVPFALCLICSTNILHGGELPSKRFTWGIMFPFVFTLHCFQAHGAYLQLLFAVRLVYEGNGESWTSVDGYTSSNQDISGRLCL